MHRTPEGPAHVSLFPMPPWELIDKYTDSAVVDGTAPPPPPIPSSTPYQMFGIRYNTDDPILRPLETFGFRRLYPQSCNRKAELKKLNFSILANYLDLLEIMTRDPGSAKRKEKIDQIGLLFINMHHLLNEYRPHQARDLLREMLTYQVKVAGETVRLGEQYLARANESLASAIPSDTFSSKKNVYFADLGPELDAFLTGIKTEINEEQPSMPKDPLAPKGSPPESTVAEVEPIEPAIWSFLQDA